MNIDDLYDDIADLEMEADATQQPLIDGLYKIADLYDVDRDECRAEIGRFRENFPDYPKPNVC